MIDYRPRYHMRPPAHWINDPNGPIQWGGRYHLFYQYNPTGPVWDAIHWGHAVSHDLVHWVEEPVALSPSRGESDEDGCWSGCAVDDGGTPTLVYTGVRRDGDGWRQTQCLATSADGLRTWRKESGNPIIAAPPDGLAVTGFRDPCVWREDGEEGLWACLVGSGVTGVGGAVLRYTSQDLRHWTYRGLLYARDAGLAEPIWTGSMWECPAFFPIEDAHALIVGVYDAGRMHHTAYFVGRYAAHEFSPGEPRRLDHRSHYYAPAAFQDAQGRRILWGWATEGRPIPAQIADGWSGAMTLPRRVSLRRDGRLGLEPVPEVTALRGHHVRREDVALASGVSGWLTAIAEDCLEIEAVVEVGDAEAIELMVRCSSDGREYTRIVYEVRDGRNGRLIVDRSCSSLDRGVDRGVSAAPLSLRGDEPLALRVFPDRSVLEVYANGHVCLTERIYPTQPDSLGLDLVAHGGAAHVRSIDIWEMAGRLLDGGVIARANEEGTRKGWGM